MRITLTLLILCEQYSISTDKRNGVNGNQLGHPIDDINTYELPFIAGLSLPATVRVRSRRFHMQRSPIHRVGHKSLPFRNMACGEVGGPREHDRRRVWPHGVAHF